VRRIPRLSNYSKARVFFMPDGRRVAKRDGRSARRARVPILITFLPQASRLRFTWRRKKEPDMRIITLLAISALSVTATAPAFAQDAMMKDSMKSDSMMKMSKMDTKKMNHCNAMSHDMMMKNARCKKMMKMHPDMMKHDDSMMAH
jgi:hypothetical protein